MELIDWGTVVTVIVIAMAVVGSTWVLLLVGGAFFAYRRSSFVRQNVMDDEKNRHLASLPMDEFVDELGDDKLANDSQSEPAGPPQ